MYTDGLLILYIWVDLGVKRFYIGGVMKDNLCDNNHLDADVLLPPRKRLLAGLKKQSSDSDGLPMSSTALASTSASCSSPSSSEFNTHLNNLLNSRYVNLSPQELVEASQSAAASATKAAEAAKAAAEEKAAIAARALAAAKSALDLVASFSEEKTCKGRYLKENKLKKHVPVQLLYKKHQLVENFEKDEELARNLHKAINSSTRISKNSPNSERKGHTHKKLRISPSSDTTRVSSGGLQLEHNPTSTCKEHSIRVEVDFQGASHELYENRASEEKSCKYDKAGELEIRNGEAESSLTKEKILDDMSPIGKRRGRVKLKKLPLSICTIRDQANPKED